MMIRKSEGINIITGKLEKAFFIARPNRFIVLCELNGKEITAYLPNPGRLWELLFPGTTLMLRKNVDSARIPYTVMALEKDGEPVLLHTHLTNTVVETLLRKKLVPGFEQATVIRREIAIGKSRFDFLLSYEGKDFVLEVKNCTLFGNCLAMFPDAVTLRGTRHLLELGKLAENGIRTGVIFAVQWPHARYFMPEYHTDIAFAKAFLASRNLLLVKALGLTWHHDLSLSKKVIDLTIPWSLIERNIHDSGCYIIILRMERDKKITIGELGTILFRSGYYLYAGSAKKGLAKRIERHQRLRKNFRWHIDYLREQAVFHKGLAIRTNVDIECSLASDLGRISGWSIPGFGCSDCSCKSHLFGMTEDPVATWPFMEMLSKYRITAVEKELEYDEH